MSAENPLGNNSENNPQEVSGGAKSANEIILIRREAARNAATETERNIMEAQSAKYEFILKTLMDRTQENGQLNGELINALNQFIDALSHQATFGEPEKPLGKQRVEELVEFLNEKTQELRWDVGPGNRLADRENIKWKSKK